MTQPFLGQIQPFGFNFAPRNWAFCNGQLLSIQQNTALFALLGTTYGGNGSTNYALPDLRGRVPMHFGNAPSGTSYVQGDVQGVEGVALNINEIPGHSHNFLGTAVGANSKRPVTNSVYGQTTNVGPVTPGDNFYGSGNNPTPINPATVAALIGGNQPHTNIQPYLTINWCICVLGIFPARN